MSVIRERLYAHPVVYLWTQRGRRTLWFSWKTTPCLPFATACSLYSQKPYRSVGRLSHPQREDTPSHGDRPLVWYCLEEMRTPSVRTVIVQAEASRCWLYVHAVTTTPPCSLPLLLYMTNVYYCAQNTPRLNHTTSKLRSTRNIKLHPWRPITILSRICLTRGLFLALPPTRTLNTFLTLAIRVTCVSLREVTLL